MRASFSLRVLFLAVELQTLSPFTNIFKGHKDPTKDLPPSDGDSHDMITSYCQRATYQQEAVVYEFPIGADLTVLQTTHDNDMQRGTFRVDTKGEIQLRRIPKNSEHGKRAYFTVDVYVSDPDLAIVRTWDEESRTLKISTPKFARLSTSGPHCVSLGITAWFPEDSEFTNLLIEAITLTLRVLPDTKVKVSRRSKFTTLSGDVWFPTIEGLNTLRIDEVEGTPESKIVDVPNPGDQGLLSTRGFPKVDSVHPFSSRRVLVETVSGTIVGSYPLLDYLGVSSQSGSINIGVIPHAASPSEPAPADLEVQTASGSIEVGLPFNGLENPDYVPPPRNYITNVHSSSGSIKGGFYLGSLGSFKSTSGSVTIKVLPIIQVSSSENLDETSKSTFETRTVSGTIDVEAFDPIFISPLSSAHGEQNPQPHPDPYSPIGDEEPYIVIPPNKNRSLFKLDTSSDTTKTPKLRNLQSLHSSSSAQVSVVYPNAWEGSIHAKTVSGDIAVSGKGMRIITERKGWAYKEVLARKGVENKGEGSMAEMSDIAGNLKFVVRST